MAVSQSVISFARGVPSPDLLPVAELHAAAGRALDSDPAGALAYGDGAGYGPLRRWIGGHYHADPDLVMCTNGSLQGLAFLAEALFAGSGGRAFVEAPTYDRAILILRRFGATIEGIPLEADGLDVERIAERCREGAVPGLVYTIPNFQNPGGVTMSEAKRERLAELASEYGFLVLEDDPYGELRFSGEPRRRIRDLDTAGRVIYSTSFTKTVAPGVRTGAMILTPELFGPLRTLAVDTYIGPSMFTEATVYQYCAAGLFGPGVERMRDALQERCSALVNAVRRHLPQAEFVEPEGGYFLWLRLPGADCDALLTQATAAGVPFVAGSSCFVDGGGRNELRLAYSACHPAEIDEGIARLASLL